MDVRFIDLVFEHNVLRTARPQQRTGLAQPMDDGVFRNRRLQDPMRPPWQNARIVGAAEDRDADCPQAFGAFQIGWSLPWPRPFRRESAAPVPLRRAPLDTACDTLALIGLAALALDCHRRVLASNGLADGLTTVLRRRADDHIALKDKIADAALTRALAGVSRNGTGVWQSFVARDADNAALMLAHVIAPPIDARDFVAAGAALVVFSPLTPPRAPPAEMLQSLFGLTQKEARVACGLAAGATLDELAAAGGVSRNTVRTQLRAVLAKTGRRRQSQIAALIANIWPRPHEAKRP